MNRYATAAALILGSMSLAHAQQAAPAALVEVEDESMMVGAYNLTVDDLEDMDIVGAGGEEIGEVDEVLMNAGGEIVAVSAEVGGFLGIGDSEVVIPLAQLQLSGDDLVTNLTSEQIEALDGWDD